MEFALLGPLVVHHSGHVLSLAGAKERGVLAFLLLRANETVPADRLIDALWPTDPPASARNSLQVRSRTSGRCSAPIESRRSGMVTGSVSLQMSSISCAFARSSQAPVARARRETSSWRPSSSQMLWRCGAVTFCRSSQATHPSARELAPLEEERLRAFEAWADAELKLGRGDELVSELQAAADANPLRERLMSQLMLALYQAGRQVEALQAYGHARRRLVHELGLEPSPCSPIFTSGSSSTTRICVPRRGGACMTALRRAGM